MLLCIRFLVSCILSIGSSATVLNESYQPTVNATNSTTPTLSGTTLPPDILLQIIDPQQGLRSEDVGALFTTAREFRHLKQRWRREERFWYEFASPYLSLRVNDTSTRVSQAFYKCARLPADSKAGLARFLGRDLRSLSETDLIVKCAFEMVRMVQTGIIPSIGRIPSLFRVQLIYQTMHLGIAFNQLLPLLDSSSLNIAKKSLLYANFCYIVQGALMMTDSQREDTFDSVIGVQRRVLAGCLLWIRRVKAPYFHHVYGSYVGDLMLQSLDRSEIKWKHDIFAYRRLRMEFINAKFNASRVAEFVDRGLVLNQALPFIGNGRVYIEQYLEFVELHSVEFRALLHAGLKMIPDCTVSHNIISVAHRQSKQELIVWFLTHGLDINSPDERGRTALNIISSNLRFTRDFSFPLLLVDLGADVQQPDSEGNVPLAYLGTVKLFSLLQFAVEHGRPKWTRRYQGETLLFPMIRAHSDLPVLQYLANAGLQLNVRNEITGEHALDIAEGQGDVVQWMKSVGVAA